ncbi:nucleotidyltransferase family protein [Prochlorococcus sp. MIT 1306]|uniref:nucleotidyltransferase family protein n=1 Tax=Prochlorococcus sp. MIT 1306 TaxID=1799667 RepID=UPI0007BB4764|nr:nucleotidyltransferase family protein [Prochlorococcus sp. MIT 1306]KZR61069.1 D-glycero-alpha-D-manno-heptose 1-phosphate guanylyltransferase [Prochlorococcus sp. MIT 1306]
MIETKGVIKPLKAILLAAGYGTRLRPITYVTPKCLVPVGEKTLLDRWINKLQEINCKEIGINLHYLGGIIEKHLLEKAGKEKLRMFKEDVLLGTAGTIKENYRFFKNSRGIIVHADNIMEESLRGLVNAHEQRPSHCIMTMLTYTTNVPESCGIVVKDMKDVVIGFHEKKKEDYGTCANGAIYIVENEFFDEIKGMDQNQRDISINIIPKLIGRIYTYHTDMYFDDIGNKERLQKADRYFSKLEG